MSACSIRTFLAALLLLPPCAVHAAPLSSTVNGASKSGNVDEADLKQYVDKKITVSGKLEDCKGDLQIKVESTAQTKVEP